MKVLLCILQAIWLSIKGHNHIYHIIIYIITWDHSHVTRNGFSSDLPCCDKLSVKGSKGEIWLYPPQRSCRGIYWFHHVRPSVRPSVDKILSYDNLSCVSQNLLKFYQLFTGEERRIPFTYAVPELLDLIWRKIGFLPYVVW
jgi:hypothetical protein